MSEEPHHGGVRARQLHGCCNYRHRVFHHVIMQCNRLDLFVCICVCQLGDSSHVKDDEECLKNLITEESERDSFTAVVITGINVTHINYLRSQVKQWTRQLALVAHNHCCSVIDYNSN